ncbi:protein kinase [Myxococcaceae bacterium GXIMD 01537]
MLHSHYHPLGPFQTGEGSRAVLALALEDGRTPYPVVLVWAPPEVVQDAERTAELLRETRSAALLEHPHILRVHGLTSQDGGLARVTEYADAESLRSILRVCKRLPPALAARLIADAASAAHHVHVSGPSGGGPLLHGDLRPETLLVSFQGLCKVTGYGALSVAPKEPDGRRVPNRRKYTAPEQLLGGRDASSAQTDIFHLGLLLYECITGTMPFKDPYDPDGAILTRELPRMAGEVPRPFEPVIRKATAKRAHERYPSALAFQNAVMQAAGEPLPSHEALGAFLSQHFPPEGEVRAARRRLLEEGAALALRPRVQAVAAAE